MTFVRERHLEAQQWVPSCLDKSRRAMVSSLTAGWYFGIVKSLRAQQAEWDENDSRRHWREKSFFYGVRKLHHKSAMCKHKKALKNRRQTITLHFNLQQVYSLSLYSCTHTGLSREQLAIQSSSSQRALKLIAFSCVNNKMSVSYLSRFRIYSARRCSKCLASINSSELVMRARHLVFHVHCFSCAVCNQLLNKGDQFGIRSSAVYCRWVCRDALTSKNLYLFKFQHSPTDRTSTQWIRPHQIRIPAPTHPQTLTVIHPTHHRVPAISNSRISTTATMDLTAALVAANRIKWEAFHLHRDRRVDRENESRKISKRWHRIWVSWAH